MPISVSLGCLPIVFIGVWILTAAAARAQEVAISHHPSPHSARFVSVEVNVQLEVLEWGGFDEFAPVQTVGSFRKRLESRL